MLCLFLVKLYNGDSKYNSTAGGESRTWRRIMKAASSRGGETEVNGELSCIYSKSLLSTECIYDVTCSTKQRRTARCAFFLCIKYLLNMFFTEESPSPSTGSKFEFDLHSPP
ncbi:hypothetical protein KP509_33G051400 [Ceratopteris richardii]|uniref:Uncharacterized protein n=1 Tax=Ceratopteris richardii TaxID=49495 RepID=A0A8T2QQ10_CERRI|nr:hypothetical protein KP509_33G051400 [Ceratopteris richardii]